MRSIRGSLAIYFVVLVTLALGAMASVVYHAMAGALADKVEVSRALVKDQCEHRCQDAHEQFDADLLAQARTLAAEAQPLFQPSPARALAINPLGALTAATSPHGYVSTPFHLGQGVRSPLTWQLSSAISTEFLLNEFALSSGESEGEYAQINTERGNVWRSESLRPRRLEIDAETAWKMPLYTSRLDDTEVDGVPVRRVVLKVPITRLKMTWQWGKRDPTLIGRSDPGTPSPPGPPTGRPGERPGERSGPPRQPSPPAVTDSTAPPMLVQVAAQTARRDQAIAGFKAERDRQLADLEGQSAQSIDRLRWNLASIATGTLLATMLGGLVLVGFGLAPLKRLSDAVSRVSSRDFRLQLDPSRLPSELAPIAGRLATTLHELELAFAREKQATADISHELRTPLAALLTNISVCLRKPRDTEQYRTTLNECLEVGRQLARLVEQLLELARMDAGTARCTRKSVDVNTLAEQCAVLVRPMAEEHGLTVAVQVPAGLVVNTDPDRLREVLTNLMSNAVEYNRPGGQVELRAEAQGSAVRFEVRDTGIGMTAEVQQRIFERFYRADPSRESTGAHSGLGLAIVKETLELLGGEIAVESEPGVGTTFRVCI